MVGLLQPIIALFKQIGSTETLSRCSRAPLERIKTDLEKYNRPNTYAGNGHSIVPARIPPNTPLYHVKQWPQGIPGRMSKPTFFGFDP